MLRLTTLGALDVRDDRGHPVRDVLRQPKRLALLVYLAVESRKAVVSRDRLFALFWPEADIEHARNALSQTLHQLRVALGRDLFTADGSAFISIPGEMLWCDAAAFSEALERKELDAAIDLYRGEFCPGLYVSGSPEVEEWLDARRRLLRRQAMEAMIRVGERCIAAGDAERARTTARRALEERPDDEADVRALLTLLDHAGDAAGALRAYDEFARRLAELDAEPSPRTRQLVADVRRRTELAPPSVPPQKSAVVAPREPAMEVAEAAVRDASARFRVPWLAGTLLAVAAVVIATFLQFQGKRGRSAPEVASVAVLPFDVRTDGPHAFLGEGIVDLMSAKLNGAVGLRAMDPRTVLATPSVAQDADWIIRGDIVDVAGHVQLTARLHGRDGGAAVTATVEGANTELFQLIDEVTGRILAGIAVGRDTALTRLSALTTNSLPALKSFLEGEQALRAGRDAAAAAAFRDAITRDSTFALAHYRLALSSVWATVPSITDPRVSASAAVRHSQRLNPLGRDLVEAYSAYREFRGDDAERLYRTITQAHPDQLEAWLMLGETLFHFNPARGRSPGEGRWPFERVLTLDPANAHAMIHLARLAALEGRLDALDSLSGRFENLYRDSERSLEMRTLQAYAHDDSAGRVAVLARIEAADELSVSSIVQGALTYAENLRGGDDLAPVLRHVRHPWTRLHLRWSIADAILARGIDDERKLRLVLGADADTAWYLETAALLAADPDFAMPHARVTELRSRIERAAVYPRLAHPFASADATLGEAMRHYLLAILSVRLGEHDVATTHIGAIPPGTGRMRRLSEGLVAGVRAELARSQGRYEAALAELETFPFDLELAIELGHFGVRERMLYGDVLRALGRPKDALRWYGAAPAAYDLPFAPKSHYLRGVINERLGNPAEARFHYGRFIRMWEHASQERQPVVDQARQALARLAGR